VTVKGKKHIPLSVSRRALSYVGLAALFFAMSFTKLFFVHHFFSRGPPAMAESTDDWAGMVAKLLDDHQQLSTLAQNSLAFSGNFSVEKIAEKVLTLYRRVIVLHQSKNS
jgi:glycosyltransferase involved in cell wall biosynthesis